MTLDRLRPLASRAISPFVAAADRIGLSPNAITTLSVVTAAGGGTRSSSAGRTRRGTPSPPRWSS